MILYDEPAIQEKLDRLPNSHRSVFALGQAERWIVAYEQFVHVVGEGDTHSLRSAIQDGWNAIITGGRVSLEKVEAQLAIAEQHTGQLAEAAQAAAFCACYALDATNDPGKCEHAMFAARWVYNAIDAWLGYELGSALSRETSSPKAREVAISTLDDKIAAHPRMQRELQIIESALEELASIPQGNVTALLACRTRWATAWPALD